MHGLIKIPVLIKECIIYSCQQSFIFAHLSKLLKLLIADLYPSQYLIGHKNQATHKELILDDALDPL